MSETEAAVDLGKPEEALEGTPPIEGEPEEGSTVEKEREEIRDDPDYYIQGDFVVFLVENYRFRVPSYRFITESEVFASMFMCPQPPAGSNNINGSSAGDPIFLPYTTVSDFRNFLKALYPRSFDVLLTLSKEEWFSVLTLSNQWYFLRLRAIAISELNGMSDFGSIEKIILGRNLKVASWVVQGFLELILRDTDTGISDDEARKISLMTTINLLRIREARVGGRVSSSSVSILAMIETRFEDELVFIRGEEEGYSKVFDDIDNNVERAENIKRKKTKKGIRN